MKLNNKKSNTPFIFVPPTGDGDFNWKPVQDLMVRENAYIVDMYGNVFGYVYGDFLKWQTNHNGYQFVCMDGRNQYITPSDKGARYQRKVHRLVMIAFNPVPGYEKLQVNHMDGNKKNNHISNLEWCTGLENTQHAVANGLRGDQSKINRLDKETVKYIKQLLSQGYTHKQIYELLDHKYSVEAIDNVSTGRCWSSVEY